MSQYHEADYHVCENCQAKLEELLKQILHLRAEKKKFEDLYKSKCCQELRTKAEILGIKADFENRLYQLKEDEQLGLIKYMSSRIAVQDKLIYDNSRELAELRRKLPNSTVEKDIQTNVQISSSFDESLNSSRDRLGFRPIEKEETKAASAASLPKERQHKLLTVPLNQRPPLAQLRHSFRFPPDRTQKHEFQRERHGSFTHGIKMRSSQPPLPVQRPTQSTSLRRNGSFQNGSGGGGASRAAANSRLNQESSVRASSTLSHQAGKKDYLASLENAVRVANKEKILLERQIISHMDSMITSNTEVPSLPRQQSIQSRHDDRPTTTGSDFEDRTLFEAMKDTNEALKAELARLTPFEQQVTEMAEQVKQLKLRESNLQSMVDNLKDTNSTLSKENEDLKAQISERISNVKHISHEFEKNILASKQRVKLLMSEKETLHNLQQESNQTITEMKKTISDLQQENQKITEAKSELETVEKSQQAEIEKLKFANQTIMSQLNAARLSNAQCSKCLEKDTLIAKQNRQIELLRELAKTAKRPATVTVGTNTMPAAASQPSTGQRVVDNISSARMEKSIDLKDASSSTDSAIDIFTPEMSSKYSACHRSSSDVIGSPTKVRVVNAQPSFDDNLESKSFTLNLSEDFRVLRETMQESEQRHKQLEKDYERTLMRLNMKDEELDRLRRV